ncbi:MAG TPA: 2-oxo acid dehydrogenase subunit E2, partial [Bacteroidales bacterium]|nr:2-oxo acid dehydrogenase subunit E2 [Bacteroidales bacterium]
EITREIEVAKDKALTKNDIVLNEKPKFYERLYYRLPGAFRRRIWRILLRYPKIAYKKMGNVVVTSPGMMGTIKGWFIHKTVHPLSFGIGSVLKKPVVIGDEVKVREILNMTILIDHDVIDGAPMVRFLNDLTRFIESGSEL